MLQNHFLANLKQLLLDSISSLNPGIPFDYINYPNEAATLNNFHPLQNLLPFRSIAAPNLLAVENFAFLFLAGTVFYFPRVDTHSLRWCRLGFRPPIPPKTHHRESFYQFGKSFVAVVFPAPFFFCCDEMFSFHLRQFICFSLSELKEGGGPADTLKDFNGGLGDTPPPFQE